MKTFAEFKSNKFPPYDGEQEQINPGLWGKRLAEYFVAKLPQFGISAAEPIAEDWGWYLPVTVQGTQLALCCGHQDGDDDEFLVFTEPSQPVTRKLFKKIDVTVPLTQLTRSVEAILTADSEIREVKWREP